MATDGEMISLMAHTLGSIGQVVKDISTLRNKYSREEGFDEVLRIYNGFVIAIRRITNTEEKI